MWGYGSNWDMVRPWGLLLLLAVPLLVYVLFFLDRRRRATFIHSRVSLFTQFNRGLMVWLWPVPKILRILAVVCAIVALVQPRCITKVEEREVEGIDIILTLDISTSMNRRDLDTSRFKHKDRLEVAKEVIDRFIAGRTRDRIGLVIFNREAYTQCPLTFDYGIIRQILKRISMNRVERLIQAGVMFDRTAIGNAVGVSINRLRDSESKSKAIILLTDGQNNAGNIAPLQAAKWAYANKIKVFPILVGKGDFVGTRYVEVRDDLLKEIAHVTGGEFYRATDRKALERRFHLILNAMKKTKMSDIVNFRHRELFTFFLWIMFGLLLAEVGIRFILFREMH